jgi:hypothetical protein
MTTPPGLNGPSRELAGQLDIRYEREGVCCTIAVPLGSTGQQAA